MANSSLHFAHLHHHSTFSPLDGFGTPADIVARAKELGHRAVALTDHGTVAGHAALWKATKGTDFRPVYGIEAYITEDHTKPGKKNESLGADRVPHITLLAATQVGYANLLHLVGRSYASGDQVRPRIDRELLAEYQEGVVVLSGCPLGWPTALILNKGPEAAWEWLAWMKERVERLYVELVPSPGKEFSTGSLPHLLRIARDLDLPTTLTADAHWPRPDDYKAQTTLMAAGLGASVNNPNRFKLDPLYHTCTARELFDRARQVCLEAGEPEGVWDEELKRAIARAGSIADGCEVELPTAAPVRFWGFRHDRGEAADAGAQVRLRHAAAKGLTKRAQAGLVPEHLRPEYDARLARELDVLCEKGFAHYMLIVIDIIREMRSRGSLILTRGSAGGCLVLWACGASLTDPIRHGLSFERFLDHTRADPPDVDIDFEKQRRDEAFDYIADRYGRERVAHIATFGQLKARGAVQKAGQANDVPLEAVQAITGALRGDDDDLKAQLDVLTDPKALAALKRFPCLRIAEKLVGQTFQQGVHAAGLLVSSEPLEGRVGVMRDKQGRPVAAFDKKAAADLGYLKIDCLAVEGVDVVADAVRAIAPGDPAGFLEAIPLDDATTLDDALHWLAGVFQLDGAAAARAGTEIGLDTFDDIVVAGSICRPGPSQFIPIYARNKHNAATFAAYLAGLHPAVAAIVRPTFGVIVYQEQVMAVAREVVGLDWRDVHRLRKEVSQKVGATGDSEANRRWSEEWEVRFVEGCGRQGIGERDAKALWAQVQTHGGYSFNKSHCVTYALLGYWMLYLKRHHPTEFYAAYLAHEESPITRKKLLREFLRLGGRVVALDPALSQARTSAPEPKVLVGGLADLTGCGEKTAAKVLAKGPFFDWAAFLAALPKATREAVERAGLPNKQPAPQELAGLAPWFPVVDLDQSAKNVRNRKGWQKASDLPEGEPYDGDTYLCGYVTGRKIEQKKIQIVVEDETGAVPVAVAKRRLAEVGPSIKAMKNGDLVLVVGWWSGDTLYVKSGKVLRSLKTKVERRKEERSGT